MFSGIVADKGSVVRNAIAGDGRLAVAATSVVQGVNAGDSIAVNGCCLTVVEADGEGFVADVMPETARRTNLAALAPGDAVNLEAAMVLGDRLGGHMVSGHIDGVGEVLSLRGEGNAVWVELSVPDTVVPYIVERGCIAVDGISLTVVEAGYDRFTVSLIPHTLAVTRAGGWVAGSVVNLEADLVAKYVERGLRTYAVRAVSE
jgi:riboflavin synthase